MKISPPKWADKFLQWYCRPDLLEEIQGDAYELFYRTAKERKRKADFYFVWNVVRFFRLKNIKKRQSKYTTSSTMMFKNYLITGYRNAVRNSVTTTINILGLSLGVGIAITVFIFLDFNQHIDGFHVNHERIYQITSHVRDNDTVENWGDSPFLLAPSLKSDHAAIESAVRVEMSEGAVRHDDIVFNESIWFVDADFLEIFSFPTISGRKESLKIKEHVVITKEIALKYFGTSNPMDQILSIKFSNGTKEEFAVSAIIDRPGNSGMSPSILLSMEKFRDLKLRDAYNWSSLTDATFVMLKEGHSIAEMVPLMKKYKTLQNNSSPEWVIEDFEFMPLTTLSKHSFEIESAISYGPHPSGTIALSVTAGLLLLLACFNYMNVAVATIATRLKEIGIRKVIGGNKNEIIKQFLTENFLFCAASLILGTSLAYLFLMPGFNALFTTKITFDIVSGHKLILFFSGLLISVGLISGAYPALYVSSFQPIQILKGREKFGQRSLFSRILLTVQLIIAFTTIVASFVFVDNSLYLKNKDWGYDHQHTLVVPVGNKEQFLKLRDKVSSDKQVYQLAGSLDQIGYRNRHISFDHLQQRFPTIAYRVGFDYLETMNLRLKEGRSFKRQIQSDHTESVIVNETFVKQMNWTEPLKASFELDSVKHYVIGVVYDFHYEHFYEPIGPVMFTITSEDNFRFLSLKVSDGSQRNMEASIKETWKEIAPDDPYQGFLQDSVFEDFHRNNNSNMIFLSFVSVTAIVLACLGLFGLVAFNITRRLKEFSIRKVFGANLFHIFKLMNRDYVWILLIAFVIGAPTGFFMINLLIQQLYPFPQSTTLLPFLLAIAIMVGTVGLTIGSQLRRIVKENPTETLRND
jgi:putative ABC transport system permease protein